MLAASLGISGCLGCGGPTAPTAPPNPTSGPILTCPSSISTTSVSASGVAVPYTIPAGVGGRAPVSVTCTPASGQVFPVGSTPVTCTATDAASQTASCSFQVTVTQTFRLALTKFLAFGDSVTAGEVTVPTSLVGALGHPDAIYQQIVVAAASYPTVLKGKLSQRYTSQTLTVENAGRNGEFAANAFPRFVTTMNASQPEVLLLLMGYNDVSEIKSLKPAISALEQMVVTATGRGVRVALATLTPGIPGRSRSTPVDILLAYNDAIRALAASDGVVLVDLYQAGLPQANSWIGVDGLHPNETGYAGIADAFFAAVQANLEVR